MFVVNDIAHVILLYRPQKDAKFALYLASHSSLFLHLKWKESKDCQFCLRVSL